MLKSNKGFSLIELMVVVAIIGILASVAVPNFQKFQAKARQGEAKSLLSGLYMAEESFFSEWQQYYGNFQDIGFAPAGNLRYRVGFTAGNTGPNVPNYNGPSGVNGAAAAAFLDTAGFCGQATFGGSKCTDSSTGYNRGTAVTFTTASAAAAASFTAQAVGQIDGDASEDRWTINEAKSLANAANDVATE